MGVVYEAIDRSLGRSVALKLLAAELSSDPEFVERFRREGKLQAALRHPHIATVYDAGWSARGLYLAMQLIRGPTLAALLVDGVLTAQRALRVLAQLAGALDYAHAQGLVHRDVKPKNALVSEGGDAYLVDFGLTKVGGSTGMTMTGQLVGTLAYLAPEVIRGAPATPASDRYAFAAMLYECFAGSSVFPRSSPAAVLFAHTSEPPPRISHRRQELTDRLDDVLISALAKDPRDRPATATALVDAVVDALAGVDLEALGPPAAGTERFAVSETVVPVAVADPPPARRAFRRRGIWLPVVTALAGAALATGVTAVGGDGDGVPANDAGAVPSAPAGVEPLGSSLASHGAMRTVDCSGGGPSPASGACTLLAGQRAGPDLIVPRDGAIRGWAVRGASGEIAIRIFRGRELNPVADSRWQVAPDGRAHRFAANLAVKRGDRIGLQLGRGAAAGVQRREDARTIDRIMGPELLLGVLERSQAVLPPGHWPRLRRAPSFGAGHELLLRVDYVPGAQSRQPEHVRGAAAAAAARGQELRQTTLRGRDRHRLRVALVALGDRVMLDLSSDGRRIDRLVLPGLLSRGKIVRWQASPIPRGNPIGRGASGMVRLRYVNPGSNRVLDVTALVHSQRLDYIGE